MDLAREAYEAYANHTGWKSLATGANLPQWDLLPVAIKEAWQVSATWVAGRVSGQHDWLIPVRDAVMAARIDADHSRAGDLVRELMENLGCTQTVNAWNRATRN